MAINDRSGTGALVPVGNSRKPQKFAPYPRHMHGAVRKLSRAEIERLYSNPQTQQRRGRTQP